MKGLKHSIFEAQTLLSDSRLLDYLRVIDRTTKSIIQECIPSL